ncbi:glycoside hydrolase family 36 protein [Bacteroidota bacterium]
MNLKLAILLSGLLIIQFGCQINQPELSIEIEADSGNPVFVSSLKTSNLENDAKLLSLSITNKGEKTEYLKNIRISIPSTLPIETDSRILYAGHDMGRTPIQQRSIDDEQLFSGSFVVLRHNESSYSKTGILTWNVFRPYISFVKNEGIVITADGENKPLKPGESIDFEQIVMDQGSDWQDLLFSYGEQIAEIQDIQPKEMIHFKAWSTWDYYGRNYNDKDIYKNIDQLEPSGIEANLIQIDGGWWTVRGDYLSVKKELPDGMKGVADYILSKGYIPGIHLDGFRADKASKVYSEHPDWFLTDQNGETLCQEIQKGNDFMQYIYFDYSNPDVCDYMKDVLTTIRKDWGFSYFKIDFIRYGLIDDIFKIHAKKGITEIHGINPAMTSMERTRAGLKAMREGIGDAFFLGCSSVFGPTFGLVDGLRTGGDISPTMDFYRSRCLQNGGNFYLNKTVVQNDADYLVLRNKYDEEPELAWGGNKFGGNTTLDEAKMWSDYVSLFGGIKISSDNLVTLREERKNLIRDAFSYKTCDRFIPLDLWDHAKDNTDAFNIMLGENDDGIFLALFNWKETPIEITLSVIPDEVSIIHNENGESLTEYDNGILKMQLASHTSRILKMNGEVSFDQCRKSIKHKLVSN